MFYHIARFVVRLWLHIRFRIQIRGMEYIPEGPCILAMNHTSNYDPMMIGVHTPRKVYFMAKAELFANRFFGRRLRELGAFPVTRGSADIKSLRHTLKLLKEGRMFAIFIEGTRSETGELQIPKKGIGFIASKSQVPVVPTYLYRENKGWFGRAGIVFGPPLYGHGSDYEAIAGKAADAIRQLATHKLPRLKKNVGQ